MIHDDAPMKQEPLIYKVSCSTQSVSIYKCDSGFRLHHFSLHYSGRRINVQQSPVKHIGEAIREAGRIQLANPRANWRIVHDETDKC